MEAMLTEVRKMTVAEFRNLEFDEDDLHLYELIDGEIVKKSAPAPRYQEISAELNDQIRAFVKQRQLGRVYYAPIDVTFDGYNLVQPDLLFIPNNRLHIVTSEGIEGAPALVVEIISPTSAIRDRNVKKKLYERHGVDEYWLVDAPNETIEIFTLGNGRYELFSAASAVEGSLRSKTLTGLSLDVKSLFHPIAETPPPAAITE